MCLAGSLRAKKQSSVILRDAQFSNDGALYGEGGRETKGEGRALGFRGQDDKRVLGCRHYPTT